MTYPVRRWWSPWQSQMNRLLADVFAEPRTPGRSPEVDVDETDDEWTIEVRLPGFAADEVHVEVQERELSIRADTVEERPEEGESRQYRRREAFRYRFALPGGVDADKIEATMDHGMLTIHLPKSPSVKPRRIHIGKGARDRQIEGTVTG